ncbi:hypothetical protein [Microbacterium esteraromaticum]|uniref:hypothetical protein n=1 Tax=Microbacterium esteraromaticum TaxID=57043 RepID=UPI0031D43CF6
MASFCSLTFSIGFMTLWLISSGDPASLWNVSVDAGAVVLDHLGWAFGVYVPTLLGFYVLVTGEQLGSGDDAGRLRRLLGGVAELSFAALLPGVALVALYCLSDPRHIGALFVVLPATLMLGFLAVELGVFVVFDTHVQLADATRLRNEAATRLRRLKRRSRQPATLVVLGTVLTLTAVGAFVLSATNEWAWIWQWQAYAITGFWALYASGGGLLVALARTKSLVLTRVLVVSGVVLAWAWPVGLALIQTGTALLPIVPAAATVAALAAASAFWPTRRGSRRVIEWSLAGVGALVASRGAARQYRRSARRIVELKQILDIEERPSRSRRWASLRALFDPTAVQRCRSRSRR